MKKHLFDPSEITSRSRLLVAGSLLVLVAAACGEVPGDADEDVDSTSGEITGGPVITAQGVPITSTVKIAYTRFGFTTLCTALKQGTNVFWTAGHCVENAAVGTTVQITNRLDGQFTGTTSYTRTFASIDVHPSYKNRNFVLQHNSVDYYDVGRFTLNDTTPNIPAFPTVRTSWKDTDTITFAAYGCDNFDPTQNGRKQQGSFTLVDGSQMASIGKTMDYFTHAMVALGNDPEACGGDSGAPAFELADSGFRTVGIVFHGGFGYTGFARYSNVRNWLASPAVNQFLFGFRGFIFNQYTGRCLTGGSGKLVEGFCDGRNQDTDIQSWRLADSGVAGTFHVVNGASGNCLDLLTPGVSTNLVERPCAATNSQRWRFTSTQDAGYRRLVNFQTGHCVVPSNPFSDNPTILATGGCVTSDPNWRIQAWIMTR